MGLRNELLSIPLEHRLIYNAEENSFFVNFENLYIRSSQEIQKIKTLIEAMLSPLAKRSIRSSTTITSTSCGN